jgi:probable rRNA maturation factor
MKDRPRSRPGTTSAGNKTSAGRAKAPGTKAVLAKKAPAKKVPAFKIDVLLEEPAWLDALSFDDAAVLTRRIRSAARRALAIAFADRWRGSSVGFDCCLVLSNDRQVRHLNRDYRNKDKPTNVLSFAALDGGMPSRREIWPLGDVILALGVCRKEAKAQRKSLDQHVMHLVIHGVLHLLGYDHEDDDEAERMEGLEIAALKRLGIDNPYLTV